MSQPVGSTGHNFSIVNSTAAVSAREGGSEAKPEKKTTISDLAAKVAVGIVAATTSVAAAPPPEPAAIVQTAIDYETLSKRLVEAAGNAISDPASAPGLLVMSEPMRWLSSGCDLELDVLPAIKSVAAREGGRRRGGIRSWSYFTQAVANARATRMAPMPEGQVSGTHVSQVEALTPEQSEFKKWKYRMDKWNSMKRIRWPKEWGPSPGSVGCDVPSEILSLYGF